VIGRGTRRGRHEGIVQPTRARRLPEPPALARDRRSNIRGIGKLRARPGGTLVNIPGPACPLNSAADGPTERGPTRPPRSALADPQGSREEMHRWRDRDVRQGTHVRWRRWPRRSCCARP
jgi:hypothetical protein